MKEPKPSKSLIPETAVALPADVERFLKITPERKEDIAQEQARLAKLSASRARPNKGERERMRGIALENHYTVTGNKDGLATAYAMQGRFQEAAQAAVTPELKTEFSEFAKAVFREDLACRCDKIDGNNLPTESVVREVWSLKHKRMMPIIQCGICGDLNARKLPENLAAMKQARAQAVATKRDQVKTFDV